MMSTTSQVEGGWWEREVVSSEQGVESRWYGVGESSEREKGRRWRRLLWSLVYPPPGRGHRIMPTLPGVLLISVALGMGAAAYNTGSNILFITLSLLLSCLVLSGLLSWMNVRGIKLRLTAVAPWRAGQDQVVALELRNEKAFLPTYGLWFDMSAEVTGEKTRLPLGGRLDGGEEPMRLEWMVRPKRRGKEEVVLVSMGSLFPFGFLSKSAGCDVRQEVVVWPEPVEYLRVESGGLWRQHSGQRTQRSGMSGDLMALRAYARGDSHRLVHWKATARLKKVMVRQFSAESEEGFMMWVDAGAERWPRKEQFELMVSLAATLGEDLFRMGRLMAVAVNGDPMRPVRKLRDLELFLDRLALLEPMSGEGVAGRAGGETGRGRRNLMTFAPEGARGVNAFVDGNQAATA